MLRDYQESAIQEVKAHWANGVKDVLLVAPTGSGKTEMGTEIVRGQRVLFVVHLTELLDQTAKRLREALQEPVGIIQSDAPIATGTRVHVGMVQTLMGRSGLPEVDVVVLDEAHHYVAEQWGNVPYACKNAKKLGLTATPERADGRPLGDLFSEIVVAAHMAELQADGHLVPLWCYRPNDDLEGNLVMSAAEAVMRYASNDKSFVFCPRVDICHETRFELRRHGFTAEVIDYKTEKSVRRAHMNAFAANRLQALICVDTLTEGVDVPDANVAILARRYHHPSKLIQAAGRVLRPAPGKSHAKLYDLTGCTLSHGLPTDPMEYSLTGKAIRRKADPIQEPKGLDICGGDDDVDLGRLFSQEIVGGELRPAPGAPPLPKVTVEPRTVGHADERSKRWSELLAWAKSVGKRRSEAESLYHQEFGAFP